MRFEYLLLIIFCFLLGSAFIIGYVDYEIREEACKDIGFERRINIDNKNYCVLSFNGKFITQQVYMDCSKIISCKAIILEGVSE